MALVKSSDPAVGDRVRAFVPIGLGDGGTDVADAAVIAVHGKHPDGGYVVSLHVFPDASEVRARTSVRLLSTEVEARAAGTHAAFRL